MNLDVVFRNDVHQKLVGVLSYPPGREKLPGIILCHGFAADMNWGFLPDLADELVNKGFAVLRFDCRACGKSEGEFHPTYKTMIDDISAAINFMKKQGRISDVGLAGHSMGGTSVIMAASEAIDVKAVVSYGAVAYPFSSGKKKKEILTKEGDLYTYVSPFDKHFKFTEDWFVDAGKIKPLETIKDLDIPIMIIHGTEDASVSVDEGKQLFMSAKFPKSINMISGARHQFKDHYESLISSTRRFFEMWLQKKE